MARASAARRVSVQVLGEVRRREGHAREILRASARMASLGERDRAHATRLVLGVVATSGLLDSCMDARLARRAHLQPKVRDALRVSAYELLFLSTPSAVAVSQGVELVRRAAPAAAGLANAVLRRIAAEDVPRREDALAQARAGRASVDQLALVSGYPAWVLAQVDAQRGSAAAHDLALSALEPAPVYVAPNLARHTSASVLVLLKEGGLAPVAEGRQTRDAGDPGSPSRDGEGAIVLGSASGLADSGLVQNVDVVVADLSAQRVAHMVTPRHDASMLEVGQGRGTKSILMQNAARREHTTLRITGTDSQEFKVRVAQERMLRARLSKLVSCCVFDACDLASAHVPAELVGPFDVVFVDAPCSGTGTLRRHPEIAWSLTPSSVSDLGALQLRMLAAASARVREGGLLCYATCSVLEQENQEVVNAFLRGADGRGFVLEGEPFQSIPARGLPDGHFCARMRRVPNVA